MHPARIVFSKPFRFFAIAGGLVLLFSAAGCRNESNQANTQPPPQRPLRSMNSLVRRGQWQQAWELADSVLETHPEDAEAIAVVARVAHEVGQPESAADLLIKACRAEGFRKPDRVRQAMIAVVGVGKLYEGMAMLEEAITAQPEQDENRRWLFDFYMGTEDRVSGTPHGRYLVQKRKFDLKLLKALSNTERRNLDDKPLEEMTSRNPDDKRPLLGAAKRDFDEGRFDQAVATLRTIADAHPGYFPAQALLGRALAAAGKLEEVKAWVDQQPEEVHLYSDYWIALGDWARATEQDEAAASAYWEATKRDADVVESWSKLSTMIQRLQSKGSQFPEDTRKSIEDRATRLSTFGQLKHRFERTGDISRATVVEIVHTLRELGRLWEAEAWASVALSLPEDDEAKVNEARAEVVALMNRDTPWQLVSLPEFQIQLSHLESARDGMVGGAKPLPDSSSNNSTAVATGGIQLKNEASERGLEFFGRTSDALDQPGIGLHETLGCGGGTIDFDLDGWQDLYLVAAGGEPARKDSAANALFQNRNGKFVDVTQAAATGDSGFGQGTAVGDVNQDGFPDILVLNYGTNALLINNGDGTFRDASDQLPTGETDWSTSGAIADLDGDGLTDIVVLNYCAGLEPVTDKCPMQGSDISRSCTPMKFPGLRDQFLQCDPKGAFVDQTEAWEALPAVLGRGLGVVVGSFDDSPGLDTFVANDMTNNHFWSARPGDKFKLAESAMLRGLGGDDRASPQGSMGIATADLDTDGEIDFYVTNFDNEYNTLHSQRGAGTWQDQTTALKLATPTMPLVGFGSEAVDFDNDGRSELVVSNGHVDMFSRGEEKSIYAHPMQIFRWNPGSKTYDSIGQSLSGDYPQSPHVGRALWTIDANQDGQTDLAVTHQTEPVALLINHTTSNNHWISLDLCGRGCERDAIGAIVKVSHGSRTLTQFVVAGSGYLCSNDPRLTFGLGSNGGGCDVEITWPDGTKDFHESLAIDRNWVLVQQSQ